MRQDSENKLNLFLRKLPRNVVVTNRFLHELGISDQLKKKYETSGWLTYLGYGAATKYDEKPKAYGALDAIINQLHLQIHIGAKSAFELHGRQHYMRFNSTIYLFSQPKVKLPQWFKQYNWETQIQHIQTQCLHDQDGVENVTYDGFKVKVSSLERAILETLYMTPQKQGLSEAYHLLESLVDIRPAMMQNLLEKCKSIKVKRLFLIFAEKANLPCVDYLERSKIDIGTGKLSLTQNGQYHSKYKIVLPKGLFDE